MLTAGTKSEGGTVVQFEQGVAARGKFPEPFAVEQTVVSTVFAELAAPGAADARVRAS